MELSGAGFSWVVEQPLSENIKHVASVALQSFFQFFIGEFFSDVLLGLPKDGLPCFVVFRQSYQAGGVAARGNIQQILLDRDVGHEDPGSGVLAVCLRLDPCGPVHFRDGDTGDQVTGLSIKTAQFAIDTVAVPPPDPLVLEEIEGRAKDRVGAPAIGVLGPHRLIHENVHETFVKFLGGYFEHIIMRIA